MFSLQRMAAILDIWVKMMLKRKSNIRIGILVVELVEKMYLYLILGALAQKLFFQNGASGHFGLGPLAKNASIFARGRVSHFFIKGP